MPSNWSYPTSITQYGEVPQHIDWLGVGSDFTSIKQVRTRIDLSTIADDLRLSNIQTKSYYLVMTGFHWDDITDPINGFEVYINLKRKGRILDETIGLWYNGEQVGGSKADGDLSNIKTYGGSGDTWNFEQISSGILNSGNFGLLLRYQSNINWPHRDTPNMIQVQARVW